MDTIIVKRIERRTKKAFAPSLAFPHFNDLPEFQAPDRIGTYAEIENEGSRLELSRFDDESGWTVDAAFGKSGFPMWANGFGARYLVTKRLNADVAAVVDAAARSVGATA